MKKTLADGVFYHIYTAWCPWLFAGNICRFSPVRKSPGKIHKRQICTRQLTALQKIIWSVTTSLLLIWRRFRNNLSLAANYPDTIIWIINSNGQIILSTRKDISPDNPINLEGFNGASWDSNYVFRLVISTDIFPRHISARLHQSPRI